MGQESATSPRRPSVRSWSRAECPGARIPHATYRLQFTPLVHVCRCGTAGSLSRRLGVSDCYASPYFKACPGSPHGYDVIDHNTLNPEIGS